MSRNTNTLYSKIIGLIVLSTTFSLPVMTYSSTKTLLLFPLAIYAEQSKAYLGQGINSMLISRISGVGVEIVPDEKYRSLLDETEKAGKVDKQRAEELARALTADYAIFGGYSLDLSLLEVSKPR